jgi:hypothetical protein
MKALIIDEPWITEVLEGRKVWEMRKTACHHRGRIALIRKGSGQVVGVVEVVDSLARIDSLQAYAEAEGFHRIPLARQETAFADGWRTPWVLADVRSLSTPVAYRHPQGAVIWVNLEPQVTEAIIGQIGQMPQSSFKVDNNCRNERSSMTSDTPISRPAKAGTLRYVRLTGGNLRHHHIYLPLDFFPADAIGGRNKSETASKTLTVTFQPGLTVETDIDRGKKILRARSAIRDFLAKAGCKEGDTVRIACVAPYVYEFTKGEDA